MTWIWGVFVFFLLLGTAPTAQAAFPTSRQNTTACTTAPCNGWYIVEKYLGVFPTRQAACDAEFADYVANAPRGTSYYSGKVINENTEYIACMVLGYQGSTNIGTIHHFQAATYAPVAPVYGCPAGATQNGGLCTCTAPHVENATQNGCTAVATPPETEACTADSGQNETTEGYFVIPSSGEVIQTQNDYKGTGAQALSFVRSFRSQRILGAATSAAPTGLGAAWSHNYATSLKLYGTPGSSTRTAAVLFGNGSVRAFNWDAPTSSWKAFSGTDTLLSTAAGATYKRADDDSTWQFDAAGKLLSHTPRNGLPTALQYNNLSQLTFVTNRFGRQLKFGYNAAGLLTTMTAPGGEVTTYGYDSLGNLLTTTWPDGNIRRFHYEDSRFPRSLTGVTDETGQRISTYTYDAQGRVTETQRAGGVDRQQYSYSTSATGLPQTQVTDFSVGTPTVRTHDFVRLNQVLRPAAVSAPCPTCSATAQATQYNTSGLKTRELAHDGSVIFYAYNTRGQEIERATFPASFASATARPAVSNATSVISTQWHATWNLPIRITEPRKNTIYTYSASGITLTSNRATTDATGAAGFGATLTGPVSTTQYGYNTDSLLTSITELTDGVQTQRWNLTYNTTGDLASITDVTGGNQSATLTNDAQGRITRISASNGAQATFAANSRGQMTAAYTPKGNVTYAYDARNLINEIRFSDGRWVRYSYNAAQKLIEIRDSSGQLERLASNETEGLDPQRLMHRVAQWLVEQENRVAQMLVPSAHANPALVLVPMGVVLGIMAVGEAQRQNATRITSGSGASPVQMPSVTATSWLLQTGILLTGQSQISSTAAAPTYDQAGLLVSPKACLPPPGNCDPGKWKQLQDDVNAKCKTDVMRCTGNMPKVELALRLDRSRACAIARDKINKTCFAGGDENHRNRAIEAWNGAARCESWLAK